MAIDPEVISPSSEEVRRSRRYIPRWTLYSAGGVCVLFLVVLVKALLPLIGMGFLLAYIWSQSTTTRRY
tara:strand:+ start:342 stop:548 length:207 start_codon:yes stop_codon:yes gene_type:complete